MDVELLYNSVKTEVRDQLELQTRCGREGHTRPKGPLEPLMSWGPEKLLIRCGRESHSRPKFWRPVGDKMWQKKPTLSRKLSPWASGWAALENEKDTTLTAIKVGVNILQLCSVSSSLSHTNVTIKWDVYFLKKYSLVCLIVMILLHYDNISLFCCVLSIVSLTLLYYYNYYCCGCYFLFSVSRFYSRVTITKGNTILKNFT